MTRTRTTSIRLPLELYLDIATIANNEKATMNATVIRLIGAGLEGRDNLLSLLKTLLNTVETTK